MYQTTHFQIDLLWSRRACFCKFCLFYVFVIFPLFPTIYHFDRRLDQSTAGTHQSTWSQFHNILSHHFVTTEKTDALRQPPSPYSSIFVVNFSLLALHKRYTNALLHSTTVTTAITTTETHHSYNFHTVKQLVNVPFSVRVPQQHIYTTTPNIVGHFQCSHYHFGLLLWVALVLVSHCSEWMNANWITQRHKPQNDLILFFLFHCFVTTATLIYKLFLF